MTAGAVELEVVDAQEMRGSNPVRQFFFGKKSGECGENKNFTAKNLTKIHRFHRINRKKMRALCGEIFFHRYSPQFLH